MHGGVNVQPGQIEEGHYNGRAADDVVAGGCLNAGVGDFDRKIPCGDLAMGLAQAALHTRLHFQLAHAAQEIPFIPLGAAGRFDESRVIHVRTQHPCGFALGFAVLVRGQQVAKLVAL